MSKLKSSAAPDIERAAGNKVIVGDKLTLPEAAEHLLNQHASMREVVGFSARFRAFPWDVAVALQRAMSKLFNVQSHKGRGGRNVQQVEVEIGLGKTTQVAFGPFQIPGVPGGQFNMAVEADNDGPYMMLHGKAERQYGDEIQILWDEVRSELLNNSIYRGQAIRVKFRDIDGELSFLEPPKFIETGVVDRSNLLFDADIAAALDASVFAPVLYPERCVSEGVSRKKMVLLSGPYGTGKTQTAVALATECVKRGITYMYCDDVQDFEHLLNYAKLYSDAGQQVVLFAEDIDRAVSDRTDGANRIINMMDGVDTKGMSIRAVLTTNHVERLDESIKRQGRFDQIIELRPPSATVAGQMVKLFAGGQLSPAADLAQVGKACAGLIPAAIKEVVELAKLTFIARTEGNKPVSLGTEELVQSAVHAQGQVRMRSSKVVDEPVSIRAARILAGAMNGKEETDQEAKDRELVALRSMMNEGSDQTID